MEYNLPNGYTFQIVRIGVTHNVNARLLDGIGGGVVDTIDDFETSLPLPVGRMSAGNVLFHMLRKIDGQCRKVLSQDDLAILEDRAMQMAGLERVTTLTPET